MRIISGNFKGYKLFMAKNKSTRPLKDNARESIFNLLTHSNNILFKLDNSNILDLYAGTGSFGLECLSRNAKSVCFVEKVNYNLERFHYNVIIANLFVKIAISPLSLETFSLIFPLNFSCKIHNFCINL